MGNSNDGNAMRGAAPQPQGELTPDTGVSAPWVRWVAAIVIVVALVGGLLLYYNTRVCDENLTSQGTVVEVCRSLQATDPPVMASGLIALVALTAFFSEITGFGVSLKRNVRANTAKADSALTRAKAAEMNSDVAQDLALRRNNRNPDLPDIGTDEGVIKRVEKLTREYNRIREREASGSTRTGHMTSVVTSLISELSGVPLKQFPLRQFLTNTTDGGRRVAGYAYLYANPRADEAMTLVQSILAESTPFGQYWGLRALYRLVQSDPNCLDFNSRRQLEQLSRSIGQNTDRAFELRRILTFSPHV